MGELTAHTDVLLESARNLLKIYPNAKFLVPANNDRNYAYISSRLKENPIKSLKLYKQNVEEIIGCSNIAIVASGTATLEVALHKKPMIIIYKGSWISYFAWKMLRLIPNVGLPNILLKENIVPEMLQHKAIPSLLSKKANEIIEDKIYLKKIEFKFQKLHTD